MKMNNFGYLVKEGIRSIFSHGLMSFASVCVTVACMLLLGIFASVMYNLNIMVEDLNQTNEIVVYIDEALLNPQCMRDEGGGAYSMPITVMNTEVLRGVLQTAIEREDYELAAHLRDVIRERDEGEALL